MAKKKHKTIEQRNGYDIDSVTEEFEIAEGRNVRTAEATTFAVLTSKGHRRYIREHIASLEEARQFADEQPTAKD